MIYHSPESSYIHAQSTNVVGHVLFQNVILLGVFKNP